MQYIYKDRIIHIEWSIFKGTSPVREDFSRALVKCFLVGPNEKYLLDATAEGGKLLMDIPQGLPEGAYSLETIYVKNWNSLLPVRDTITPSDAPVPHRVPRPGINPNDHNTIHPHDFRGNERSLMRSRVEYAFAITSYPTEADDTESSGEVTLPLKSSVASYGYDGLSAYEIAVLRGDFDGTESEWLEWTHERIVADVKDLLQQLKDRDTRFVVKTQSQRDNLPDIKDGDEVYVTDDAMGYVLKEENGERIWMPSDYGSVTAKYILSFIADMPNFVADRAIADEFGKRIVDEYLTRDAVRNYISEIYNDLFVKNPPYIMDGYITVDMLSDAVKQLIGFGPIVNFPDDEFLTTKGGRITLKDKDYNPNSYSGMGRRILRKNMVNGVNVLTQRMMLCPNTIYVISYDYDLRGQTLSIPEECTLDFQGGSFTNGVINFNNTNVKAGQEYIFVNTTFSGILKEPLNAYWVGVNTINDDNSPYLNFLSVDETPIAVYFPKGSYAFKTPITLQNYKSLIGQNRDNTIFNYIGTGILFNVGKQDLDDFSNKTGQGTYYFNMSNITINGSDQSTNVFMQGAIRESQFSHLKIKGFKVAFNLNNSWSLSFERLKITDCNVIISSGQEFNNVTFNSCYFAASLYGFVDFMGQSILFSGCSFQGFINSVFLPIYQRIPYNKLRLEALAIIGCYIETSGEAFFNLYNYDFKLNGFVVIGNTFNMTRTTSPAFYIYNNGINLPSGTISANKFRIYGSNRYPLMHIEGKTNIAVLYNDCTAGVVTGPSGESTYPLWDTEEAQKEHNAITGELKTVQVTGNYTENQGWLNQGRDIFIDQGEIKQPAWLSQEGIHEILNINIIGNAIQTGNIVIVAGGSTYTIPIEAGTTQDGIKQAVLRNYYDKYLPSIDSGVIYLSCRWRGPQPTPSINNTIGVTTTIAVNREGTNNVWSNAFGQTPHIIKGTSAQRPTLNNDEDYGASFFDATLNKPIWWNGANWIDATGAKV